MDRDRSGTAGANMSDMKMHEEGVPYCFWDEDVIVRKRRAMRLCAELNTIDPSDVNKLEETRRELFGSCGEYSWTGPGFNCDNGRNIHVGDRFLANCNVTILDIGEVRIGNDVMIGPGTLISTVNHPLSPRGRREHLGLVKPVTIGNDVWIGGNCSILPGVTIGNNVIVAAGAVVATDVPDNCLVGGVPAKIIKEIVNDVED